MRNCLCTTVMILATILTAKPASACLYKVDLRLHDIKSASVVVVGRIVDYEIVQDQAARKERKEMLARSTDKLSETWRLMSEQQDFVSDYARFRILVDEVLVGQPPSAISVTWHNSINSRFGEPEHMKEGPYLIGLRERSNSMPLHGPSATILPAPEPNSFAVLQPRCASAFFLKAKSTDAMIIRKILSGAATDTEIDSLDRMGR